MTQIVRFSISVFGVTWTLLLVVRSGALGEVWTVLAWILPTVWSPTIVALLLIDRRTRRSRTRIRARLRYRPGSGRWLLLAGVAPLLATAIAVFTARAAGDASPFISSAAIPVMVVIQLVTGAIGEEFGWRGFLLPRLGKRFGEMTAALLMATMWSLWHVAGFFVPGMPRQIMPIDSAVHCSVRYLLGVRVQPRRRVRACVDAAIGSRLSW